MDIMMRLYGLRSVRTDNAIAFPLPLDLFLALHQLKRFHLCLFQV